MADVIQNEWNVIPTCVKACFCTACMPCWSLEALGKDKKFACFLGCCQPMPSIAISRTLTREKYGIDGDDMGDWCLACCCPLCADFQVAAEMKLREENA